VSHDTPAQSRLAAIFAVRMASSHGLAMFLIWLAFERESAATAGWVLVVRAVASLVVPLAVGHLHDQGRLGPWLKVCAVIEAVGAMVLAWVGWNGGSAVVMITLSVLLGATQSLFDTILHPMLLAARPGRWRTHVLVGLSYDVAKVVGSSVVLALFVVWESPIPVMVVSLLALAGWRLRLAPVGEAAMDEAAVGEAPHGEAPAGECAESTAGDDAVVAPAESAAAVEAEHLAPVARGDRARWRSMPFGPVAALGVVALLPGQAAVLQVAAADDSFARFAVLGTSFALGAIGGNLWLQRVVVRRRGIGLAYLLTAFSVAWAMVEPVSAFALYGTSMTCYYQLTRVIVVEAAEPAERGRVSAAMTAVSKVCGVGGSVVAAAAAAVDHPAILHLGGGAIALVASAAVGLGGRRSPKLVTPNQAAVAGTSSTGSSSRA